MECARDNTPETIWTPSSLPTCRIIVRIRSRAFQHRVAILRDPDDGLAMVENRVTPASVAHKPTP
jgi:hypothetical protein